MAARQDIDQVVYCLAGAFLPFLAALSAVPLPGDVQDEAVGHVAGGTAPSTGI